MTNKPKLNLAYLIQELSQHRVYLEWQLNQQDDFNKQTWYKAKLSMVESLLKELPKAYD